MSAVLEQGTALLARQPIFDDQKRVFGYELLYRGPTIAEADRGSVATARVVCEALTDLGIERVVGDAQLFINFDEQMLVRGVAALLPPGRSVVEILEDVVRRLS